MIQSIRVNTRIFILGFFLMQVIKVTGQDYTFYGNDTNTFTTTCGKIVGGFWGVKNDSCLFFTPFLHPYPGEGDSITISFTIRINQTGNLLPSDNAYIISQIGGSGSWTTEKVFEGVDYTFVHSYSDSVKMLRTDSFRIIISLENTSKTNWWQIMSGKMHVEDVWFGDPPLSVELLNFTAEEQNEFVLLRWATATEENNDYFTLERSDDCIRFEELAYIDGAGNSNTTEDYLYEDYNSINNTVYYRLKQTDFDGNFSYCSTISVSKEEENTIDVIVNNDRHLLNIVASSAKKGQMQLYIYNTVGQLIFTNTLNLEEGGNSFVLQPGIQPGSSYIVSITLNNDIPYIEKIFLN